jgi:hypothetical protein
MMAVTALAAMSSETFLIACRSPKKMERLRTVKAGAFADFCSVATAVGFEVGGMTKNFKRRAG